MSKQERIKSILANENDAPPTFLEDCDSALIGIIRDYEQDESTPVYSYPKLVEALLEKQVTEEAAVIYIDTMMSHWTDSVVILDDTGV